MRLERPSSGFNRGRVYEVMVTAVPIWFRAVSAIEATPNTVGRMLSGHEATKQALVNRVQAGRTMCRDTKNPPRPERGGAGRGGGTVIDPRHASSATGDRPVVTKHSVIRSGYARNSRSHGDRAAGLPRITHAPRRPRASRDRRVESTASGASEQH